MNRICKPCFGICLIVMSLHVRANSLEGGLTTTSTNWTRNLVPTGSPPSESERAKELAQREKDIAAEKAKLKERLTRVPSSQKMAQLEGKLKEIDGNFGWVPEIQHVYSLRNMASMTEKKETLDPGLLAGYKQFQEDLKKRGIDLIVIPFPGSCHINSHLLVDGLEASDEYYPGYAKMMLTFLENDIEVIDVMQEFRDAANVEVPVKWPNDGHTASLGRKIASEMLAERLQRYDFIRDAKPVVEQTSYKDVTWKGTKTGYSLFFLNKGMIRNKDKSYSPAPGAPDILGALKEREMTRPAVVFPNAIPDHKNPNRRMGSPNIQEVGTWDLVLIGDSQLHTPVFGQGFPTYVSAATGVMPRWGSKSWSGFDLPKIYLETVPNTPSVQPRVVVVFHLFFKLPASEKSKYGPKALPEMGETLAADRITQPFNARVVIEGFSKPKDPSTVDYDAAMMQVKAKIVSGPLEGETVGLRFEAMHDGKVSRIFGKRSRTVQQLTGQEANFRLTPWEQAVQAEPVMGTTMVYDETDLDLTAPIFWVSGGSLERSRIRKK